MSPERTCTDRDVLEQIRPGSVRLFIRPAADNPIDCFGGGRVVAHTWSRLPMLREIQRDVIEALGRLALISWPEWYGSGNSSEVNEDESAEETAVRLLKKIADLPVRRKVSKVWLKKAVGLLQVGRIPLPKKYSLDTQTEQLALVLNAGHVVMCLDVQDDAPEKGRLFGLARMAEWFAANAGVRVAVIVPENLAASGELNAINYDHVRPKTFTGGSPVVKTTKISGTTVARRSACSDKRETKNPGWTIVGRPHPGSPGEQMLAEFLARQPDLAGLFGFNLHVVTDRDNRYLVDLVWRAGKIVVEVDGYRYHSPRPQFNYDRQRDYELIVSGYLVLRLPHDDVVSDVEMAGSKIRDVVALRRKLV